MPLALDLFCGAGGVAMGLHWAGFDVVGVDIKPQPRYPFTFKLGDALAPPVDLSDFDLIWASPPCQRYSTGAKKWGTSYSHPDLIAQTRELLICSGKPYVIENIEQARAWLRFPIMLCGQYFGLGVFRHRLFETSFQIAEPAHDKHNGRVGDGKYHTVTGHAGGSSKRDGWKGGSTADWRIAMGIDWMTGNEMAEAIPPAFAEFIGRAAMMAIG
jgi:DNA (cytosine-5)-methyltransferase 1